MTKGKTEHYKKAQESPLAKKIRHLTLTAGFYRDEPVAEFLKRSVKINQIDNKINESILKRLLARLFLANCTEIIY